MLFYRQETQMIRLHKDTADDADDPDYEKLQKSREWKVYKSENMKSDVQWLRVNEHGIVQSIHCMGCYDEEHEKRFQKLVELLKTVEPKPLGGEKYVNWDLDFRVTVDVQNVVWLYGYSQHWDDMPCRHLCEPAFRKLGIEFEGDYEGGVYLNSRVADMDECLTKFASSFNDAILRWNAVENLGDYLVRSLTLTGLTLATELLPVFLESEKEKLKED